MKFIARCCYFVLAFVQNKIFKKKIIAIKHPSPFKGQKKWGDYNVACDLANVINKKERYFAMPVPYDFWYSKYNKFVDCTLLFRGLYEYKPYKNQKNLVFLISHIDEVKDVELEQYDKIFTTYKLDNCKDKEYIHFHAFTNTNFYYPVKSKNKKYCYDVLFVGNTRGIYRNAVKYCIESGIDIAVFGSGWKNFIDKKYIKGKVIDNEKVKYYYSNSKIILADHWEDMRKLGSISNRVFNISACKGFCICDDVKGIDEVFDGAVPVFKTKQELADLINYYLNNDEARREKAQKAYEITTQNYTAEKMVNKILESL